MTVSFVKHDSSDDSYSDATGDLTLGGGSPTGSAGGVLDGTYPNPGLAAGVAGNGLSESSDVLSVNVDGSSIEISSDALRVKAAGITAAMIAADTGLAAAIDILDSGGFFAASEVESALAEIGDPAVLGGKRWTTVVKTIDEDVSNNTSPQNDDELFFTATSGAVYEVELSLVFLSAAGGGSPDLKIDLGEDSTTRGEFQQFGLGASDATAASQCLSNQTATLVWGTASTARLARVIGWHAGAGGTFRLRWAQNTSGSNATTVKATSLLRYRRIN